MVHVKTQMDSEQMRIWLKRQQQQFCSPKELKEQNTLWMGESFGCV